MQFADEMEKTEDFKSALYDIVKRIMAEHDRIIFNGWVKEAQKHGLLNLKPSVYLKKAEASGGISAFPYSSAVQQLQIQMHNALYQQSAAKLTGLIHLC